jgi:GST-like protein
MINLYFHTSPNPMKVALFLEETGLAYRILAYTIADISAWGWIRVSDFVLGQGELSRFPNLARWFALVDERPAAARARAVAAGTSFKKEFDAETLRAMFPQNYPPAA